MQFLKCDLIITLVRHDKTLLLTTILESEFNSISHAFSLKSNHPESRKVNKIIEKAVRPDRYSARSSKFVSSSKWKLEEGVHLHLKLKSILQNVLPWYVAIDLTRQWKNIPGIQFCLVNYFILIQSECKFVWKSWINSVPWAAEFFRPGIETFSLICVLISNQATTSPFSVYLYAFFC